MNIWTGGNELKLWGGEKTRRLEFEVQNGWTTSVLIFGKCSAQVEGMVGGRG